MTTRTTVQASVSTDKLLTVAEVATILRVDDTTVRRWIKQGALEAVILPHTSERQGYRIRRSTLNKLLQAPLPAVGGEQG